MSRRNRWIVIIGLVCGIAPVAYLGYCAVEIKHDLRWMEARRPVLLYETNHRALLEACRELSRQVDAGKLRPGQYRIHRLAGDPDPESKQFPQLILDLDPLQVRVEKDGQVTLIMSPVVMYGVRAYPDGFNGAHKGEIELVPSLWYFDEDFWKHPEHEKEVEASLRKRKAEDSSDEGN